MKIRQIACTWVLLFSLLLFAMLPLTASAAAASVPEDGTVVNLTQQTPETMRSALAALAQADVVYLGETHDRPDDHTLQLAIIEALNQRRASLTIAMEMFQRPDQPALDRYLAGLLSEAKLQDYTQFKKRWGYPWEFYAPILRFAKANGLPVIALNTPTEVTHKTARTGLDSLSLPERGFIPPRSAIVVGPDVYRQRIRQIYDQLQQHHTDRTGFEHFFQAQVLWDETMAERIAQTIRQHPGRLVGVLVGQGHLVYGDGVPNRVARRLHRGMVRSQRLVQRSVLLNPDTELIAERDRSVADYAWYSQ